MNNKLKIGISMIVIAFIFTIYISLDVLSDDSITNIFSEKIIPLEDIEKTYDFEIQTHGEIYESSISAHDVGEARDKLLVIFRESLGTELEQSEISFMREGDNNEIL